MLGAGILTQIPQHDFFMHHHDHNNDVITSGMEHGLACDFSTTLAIENFLGGSNMFYTPKPYKKHVLLICFFGNS